jgi:hypothetical protein
LSVVMIVQAGGNAVLGSSQKRQEARKANLLSDLVCLISASWDQEGTQLIGGNSSNLPFDHSGSVAINRHNEMWIRFAVWNKGKAAADNFDVKLAVLKDGQQIFHPPWKLTLAPGTSAEYPPMRVANLDAVLKISANISVDSSKVVAEANENNNQCQYRLSCYRLSPP